MAQRSTPEIAMNRDLLRKVAANARIQLTPEEVEEFLPQLSEILSIFSTLSEVDTEGVEPSFLPTSAQPADRIDDPTPSIAQEKALRNTPAHQGYFRGPRIL